MRTATLPFVALMVCLGCSSVQAGAGDAPAQTTVTEDKAHAVAEQKGREAGYDLSVFRLVSIERVSNVWRVSFEHVPPTPPGGHFTVNVDAVSGDAELIHGR